MSRPDPKSRRFPCNKKRLTSPPSLESIGQIGNTISAFTCPVHPHVIIFPVNPTMLAKYRRAFVPSGAKDDPSDAALALDLLLRHPERLAPLKRESEDMRALRRLVQARRDLVQDRVRVTNRLTFTLKEYFPQIVEWFRDKETDVFAAFLERWPSLQAVQRARRETIVAFFHAHGVRHAGAIERRVNAIQTERPLTTDPAVIEPALAVVTTLLPQLRALSAGVARLDADIAKRCQALPDFRLFAALPGAGPVFASRLLAGFGENRQRFADAAAVQKCVGVAPVTERSGNKHWVHWRWACPTFLRQTFVEWVGQTIPRSFWAKAFYQARRARGARHQAALRALACKWIRVLHRCWVDRVAYDESRYLMALQKRQAPLLKFAAESST